MGRDGEHPDLQAKVAAQRNFVTNPETSVAEDDISCRIVGTPQDDTLRGTADNDVICSLGGSDEVVAGGGGDIVWAGPGDDVVRGGSGKDRLYGKDGVKGNDYLNGGAGKDRCSADEKDRTKSCPERGAANGAVANAVAPNPYVAAEASVAASELKEGGYPLGTSTCLRQGKPVRPGVRPVLLAL